MNKVFLIPILILLFSCDRLFTPYHEVNIKYREKNPIERLKIDSSCGNIEIEGWSNDFVEINTRKVLKSGFNQDLNLMDTLFDQSASELFIKTKIPARIDGEIHLKIYLPYILSQISVDSKCGNISVEKYLGDVEITNQTGNVKLFFQGRILRVDSYNAKQNILIQSFNSCDIMINNEKGSSRISLDSIGSNSFLDIKAYSSDLNLYLSKIIEHKFLITSRDGQIQIGYPVWNRVDINGIYQFTSGNRGKYYNNLSIGISSEKSKIQLSLGDTRYFKKELDNFNKFD